MSALELRRILHEGTTADLDRFVQLKGHSALKLAEKKALSELFLRRSLEIQEENPTGAIALLKNAVILNPQSEEALFSLIPSANKLGDFYFVHRFLKRRAGRRQFSAEQHAQLGCFYSLFSELERDLEFLQCALEHFDFVKQLDASLLTEELEILWGRTLLNLGIVSQEPGDLFQTVSYFQKIEKERGASARLYRYLARTYYQLCLIFNEESYFHLCLNKCEQALTLEPDNEDTLFFYAHLNSTLYAMDSQGHYFQAAYSSYQKLTLVSKEPFIFYEWGRLLVLSGLNKKEVRDLEEGVALFARIPEVFEKSVELLIIWAEAELEICQLLEEDEEERQLKYLYSALEKASKSVELSAKSAFGWCLMGLVKVKLGTYFDTPHFILEAVEHLQTSLSLDAKNPKTWHVLATAHHFLAEGYGSINFLKKAAKECAHAQSLGRYQVPEFYYEWGLILKKLGEESGKKRYFTNAVEKINEAIRLFQKKFPLLPVKAEWVSQYCIGLNFLGALTGSIDYHEQALDTLTQALKLNADSATLRYAYALSLANLGEATSELDFYQLAMQQFNYIVSKDPQHEAAWCEWGVTLIRAGTLIDDPTIATQKWQFLKEAEVKLLNAARLGYEASYYYLMALYSLTDQLEAAFFYLKKAYDTGELPAYYDLIADSWLDNLTRSDRFEAFYKKFL